MSDKDLEAVPRPARDQSHRRTNYDVQTQGDDEQAEHNPCPRTTVKDGYIGEIRPHERTIPPLESREKTKPPHLCPMSVRREPNTGLEPLSRRALRIGRRRVRTAVRAAWACRPALPRSGERGGPTRSRVGSEARGARA
jgi:hypothetical protein